MAEPSTDMPDAGEQTGAEEAAAGGPRGPIFRADGRPFAPHEKARVAPFDFRNPTVIGESELRRLRGMHQAFVRTLSARLSSFLRADFNFKLSKLTTLPYDQFADTINNPSHLTLFRVEPLPGIGVLEVQPRLAMNMANRMLGGKGATGDVERYLTEIEIALLEEVVAMIMAEWCTQWRDQIELTAKMVGHESNARFLQICPKETVLLVASLELQAADAPETMQIAVPFQTIEPMVKKLQQARQREVEGGVAPPSVLWRNTYDEISIPVVADWPVATLSLADVARLKPGDFLQLPLTVIDRTRVRLAEATQFVGRAGRENGRVAVQLNSRVSA